MLAIILRLIDEMGPMHVKILKYFANPKAYCDENGVNYANIGSGSPLNMFLDAFPEFEDGGYEIFLHDLKSNGLLPSGDSLSVMTSNPLAPRTTELGEQLLKASHIACVIYDRFENYSGRNKSNGKSSIFCNCFAL